MDGNAMSRLRELNDHNSRLLRLGAWSCCSVVGLFLIHLDAGPTVWTVGARHGVSEVDVVGIALILIGCLGPVATAPRRVVTSLRALSPRAVGCVAVASVGAIVLVGLVFVADFTGRQYALAGLVFLIQVAVAAV